MKSSVTEEKIIRIPKPFEACGPIGSIWPCASDSYNSDSTIPHIDQPHLLGEYTHLNYTLFPL